ncbi:MAG: O-antigen ligase family protein [Pirellulaceae bacterium]|nr:O-antigen ligase family protein [Pirellulaceae bacterium]
MTLGVIIATFAALRGWRWANRMFIVSLATHGLILLIAWNRWSIALATTGSLACLTMYLRPQTRAALATAGAILCIAYLTVDAGWRGAEQVAAPVVKYGARGQTAGQLKDASGRRQLWETMWRSYSDSPWKGHGYFVTSSTGALDIWGRRTNFTAHNMFLQALVSTGLIGCALFSLAVAWTATRIGIATWAANANGSRELFAFYLLMGAWLLAWGILNAGLLGPLQPLSVVFAVGVGLAFGRLAWDREQQLIALEAAQ